MRLKYYLRGLSFGIIGTTIVLMICFSMQKPKMSEAEIIASAKQLGMIMPDEYISENLDTEMSEQKETETETQTQEPVTESETETQTQEPATESETDNQPVPETESQTQTQEQPSDEPTNEPIPQEPFTLIVNRGDVCRIICENLAANGLVDDAEALRKYINEAGYASSITAGTYLIPYQLSYEEITQIFKAGPLEMQE